ncbi:unnamed protein product [Fraxinus pennsylvanica]|uniref:Uncharacterized protein n=1 Tax=Fraxinus pennsylvanica TaxID=56036 RepID=A0AAD1YTD9_9LAMI|nr:unnamed protein product [Fraxinus pennsylvanica]
MEIETDETGDPTLDNGNHHENEAAIINAPKVEGKRSGDVVFSREAPLERLLECNGDGVLKMEVGTKVQKFTEWALKCKCIHSHCQENKDEVGCYAATDIQLQLPAFRTIVNLAGNNHTGKDFTETIDEECFHYALFFSSNDHGWASGISATSIQRFLLN